MFVGNRVGVALTRSTLDEDELLRACSSLVLKYHGTVIEMYACHLCTEFKGVWVILAWKSKQHNRITCTEMPAHVQ